MSLTRSLLKELQISPDAAERIIAAHAESIDALRQERDAARGEAAQLESIRAALAEMTQARDEACQARDSAREELSALGVIPGGRGGAGRFVHRAGVACQIAVDSTGIRRRRGAADVVAAVAEEAFRHARGVAGAVGDVRDADAGVGEHDAVGIGPVG